MPTKLNRAGQQQNYVPSGNGDASGEYGDNESGSNKHFTSFAKPSEVKTETETGKQTEQKKDMPVDIEKTTEKNNAEHLKTVEDTYNYVSKNSTFKKEEKERLKNILKNADNESVSLVNKAIEKSENKLNYRIGSGVYCSGEKQIKVSRQDFDGGSFGVSGSTFFHENGHAFDNIMTGENGRSYLSETYTNEDGKTLKDIVKEEFKQFRLNKEPQNITKIKKDYIEQEMQKFPKDKQSRLDELNEKRAIENKRVNDEKDELVKQLYSKKITYSEYAKRYREIKGELSNEEQAEYDNLLAEKSNLRQQGANKFYQEFETVSDLYSTVYSYGFGIGHSSSYYAKTGNIAKEFFANLFSNKAVNKAGYNITKKYFPKSVKMFEEIISKYGK